MRRTPEKQSIWLVLYDVGIEDEQKLKNLRTNLNGKPIGFLMRVLTAI